jgi:hypothetical protein
MIDYVKLDGLIALHSLNAEEEPLCVPTSVYVILQHEVVLQGVYSECTEEVPRFEVGLELHRRGLQAAVHFSVQSVSAEKHFWVLSAK